MSNFRFVNLTIFNRFWTNENVCRIDVTCSFQFLFLHHKSSKSPLD